MNPMPEAMNDPRLTLLIDRYLDGSLSPAEKIELETELLAHAGARRQFWAQARLHGALHEAMQLSAAQPKHHTGFRETLAHWPMWKHYAALFVLFLGICYWSYNYKPASAPKTPQQLAVLTYRDAAAANEFETGEIILSGDLRIAQGTVELSLFNAVTLTVQGPAHLDLRSPENITLHQGRLHAHVPEPAKGFTITTSAGRLVDLGTDFGVSALAENLVEAAVFSGQVEVFAGKAQFILNANEGVRLQPGKAPEKRTLSQGHFPLPHKHLGNLLVDGDFESDTQVSTYDIPSQAGRWSGDVARLVSAENDITPESGTGMLRFINTFNHMEDPDLEATNLACEQWQVIDLAEFKKQTPGAKFQVRAQARFNRAADSIDSGFALGVYAYNGTPSGAHASWKKHSLRLAGHFKAINTDSDPATWETASINLNVPREADFLLLRVYAVENRKDDSISETEFAGHYADSIQFNIQRAPVPASN